MIFSRNSTGLTVYTYTLTTQLSLSSYGGHIDYHRNIGDDIEGTKKSAKALVRGSSDMNTRSMSVDVGLDPLMGPGSSLMAENLPLCDATKLCCVSTLKNLMDLVWRDPGHNHNGYTIAKLVNGKDSWIKF